MAAIFVATNKYALYHVILDNYRVLIREFYQQVLYISWTLSGLIFRNRNYQIQVSANQNLQILTRDPPLKRFLSSLT